MGNEAIEPPPGSVGTPASSLVRPVWIVAWISIAYGAFVVAPVTNSGQVVFPGAWATAGMGIETLLLFVVAYVEASRHGTRRHQWLAAAIAAPACSLGFAVGMVLLLTGNMDLLTLGIVGFVSLLILAWWDGEARKLDRTKRPLMDLFR